MKLSAQKIAAGAVAGAMLMPMLAFANTDVKLSAHASASTTPAQRTCMQTATSVKADANIAALDSLFASFRSAFVTRKNATVSAWGIADGSARVQALVSANTSFAASVKDSWKTFRTARANAQAAYETSVKACDIQVSKAKNENKDTDKKDKKAGMWNKFHLNLGIFR